MNWEVCKHLQLWDRFVVPSLALRNLQSDQLGPQLGHGGLQEDDWVGAALVEVTFIRKQKTTC